MIFKKYITKYLDRVYTYFRKKDKELIANEKKWLINKIRSVGYGFRLNGSKHFISKPRNVIIGNNVHIGDNLYVKSDGGLVIGHNTHISRNLTIYTENHNYQGKALPYDNESIHKPVFIGNNVWIGMNVSIIPGVTIGDGAIIGIGTTVNRDIKPLEIVGSGKVVTIKTRDKSQYDTLAENNNFGGKNGRPLSEQEQSSFLKTYSEQRELPIVFVLGTGRSGSKSIVNILNQHPECAAYHEDISQLIRLSTEIAYNQSDNRFFEELKLILETKTWNCSNDQLLIHSDQRLWNLIPFLSNYFPNAKFIHLIREPLSCIKSMVFRRWYKDMEHYRHDWDKYRLRGDLVGEFSSSDWQNLTYIQKCTWYYYYINTNINRMLNDIPKSQTYTLKLEQLDSEISNVLEFINLKKIDLQVLKSNQIDKQSKINKAGFDINELEREVLEEMKKYA